MKSLDPHKRDNEQKGPLEGTPTFGDMTVRSASMTEVEADMRRRDQRHHMLRVKALM